MKKMLKLLALIAAGALLTGGMFTSCASDDDEDDKPKSQPAKNYAISFADFNPAEDVFSVAPDETKTLVVSGTPVGTWIVDDSNMPAEISVTKNAAGNFEIKGGSAETSSDVEFKIYPQEAAEGDTSFDVTIKVSVWNPLFTVTLNLDEALAAKAAKIEVAYDDNGSGSKKKSDTVTAVLAADKTSATVAFKKEIANSYGYFSNIVVTVYDSADNAIKTDMDKNAWVCYYPTNNEYYTEISLTENTYAETTVTINVEELGLSTTDTVKVTYGITADSDTNEVDATLSSDCKTATAKVGNDHLNASNWFEVKVSVTKGGEEYTKFKADGNGWYEFTTSEITVTLTDTSSAATETWIELFKQDAYAGTGSFQKLEIETMPAAASKIKVTYASMSGSDWWCQINSDGETWDVCKGDYESSVNGYVVETSDEALISAILENGLYFVAGNGLSGNLTVSYLPAAN